MDVFKQVYGQTPNFGDDLLQKLEQKYDFRVWKPSSCA